MNFDDYMKKIQYISNILEKSKCAEDILNSKELDIAQDFEYICLSSASNYELINEVIARLAQNGNKNIVEKNVKNISMSMWKDLFDKNEAIKNIFINNFSYIYENTTIITYREIEKFVNDNETRVIIYNMLDNIIKKLCTYDRASLISILKYKENGIKIINQNLESFFQKGEFDISTTYSKILYELSQIPEISKVQILKACNKNLVEMLNRETAIDNETNKLLNWLYDTFEETTMSEQDRAEIKQNIDNAILKNFNHILDKSNYDKNTIKILKQFDCTKDKFEKNKNYDVEKLNETNQEIYENVQSENYYYTEENKEATNTLNEFQKYSEISIDDSANVDLISEIENTLEDMKVETEINNQTYENIKETIHIEESKIEPENSNAETYSIANAYINEFAKKKNNIISMQNSNKNEKYSFDEKIEKLISENIEETDKIIQKVLRKNEQPKVENTENIVNINNQNQQQQSNIQQIEKNNIIENTKINNESMDLIVKEESLDVIENKKTHVIKRIWQKIIKLFKSKNQIERIGE